MLIHIKGTIWLKLKWYQPEFIQHYLIFCFFLHLYLFCSTFPLKQRCGRDHQGCSILSLPFHFHLHFPSFTSCQKQTCNMHRCMRASLRGRYWSTREATHAEINNRKDGFMPFFSVFPSPYWFNLPVAFSQNSKKTVKVAHKCNTECLSYCVNGGGGESFLPFGYREVLWCEMMDVNHQQHPPPHPKTPHPPLTHTHTHVHKFSCCINGVRERDEWDNISSKGWTYWVGGNEFFSPTGCRLLMAFGIRRIILFTFCVSVLFALVNRGFFLMRHSFYSGLKDRRYRPY